MLAIKMIFVLLIMVEVAMEEFYSVRSLLAMTRIIILIILIGTRNFF